MTRLQIMSQGKRCLYLLYVLEETYLYRSQEQANIIFIIMVYMGNLFYPRIGVSFSLFANSIGLALNIFMLLLSTKLGSLSFYSLAKCNSNNLKQLPPKKKGIDCFKNVFQSRIYLLSKMGPSIWWHQQILSVSYLFLHRASSW